MDTSVVNRAKLVVSMAIWCTGVSTYKQRKTWKKTNIYIRERPCLKNLALGYVCVDFVLRRLQCVSLFSPFGRCFVAVTVWLMFSPAALLTITAL
jgi:hypothetical protein